MNGNRLGCLSPLAITATLITALLIGGYGLMHGNGMFSPGGLSAISGAPLGGVTSHAEIGDNCEACHAVPFLPYRMADYCLLCHVDVVKEIIDSQTLHGRLRGDQPTLDCHTCHPEHRGPDAPLTNLDIKTFPHSHLGFSLKTHQWLANDDPFTCRDCHINNLMEFSQDSCTQCHLQMDQVFTQAHALAFGFDCTNCHDGIETLGKDFDHQRVDFKLTGKHLNVTCSKCHLNARSRVDLQTAPQECIWCHVKDEPHSSRLGTACADCHTTEGWRPAKFDHNLAQFKLIGKHEKVACEKCHIDGRLQGTPTNCAACHQKDDQHNGQFKEDCSECHSPNSWDQVNADHSQFAFKLIGKHVDVACDLCHIAGVFKGTPMTCAACHQQDDKHNGQFTQDCSTCHDPSDWKHVNIDHNQFAFRLVGAHISVQCAQCHLNGLYKNTPQNCAGCHQKDDAHKGQFGADCAQCHTSNAWKPANFDHNLAQFKLTGAHVSVQCTKCHLNNLFKGTPQICGVCHSSNDPHGGQFGSSCQQCHTTNAWKPSTFNHNNAAFQLTGAHVNTACGNCHANGTFKGTPQTCGACHTKDDNHNGKFGTNCGSCHSTSAWRPATFNHNLTNFPLNGAHTNLACSQCHGSNIGPLPTACSSCHSEPTYHAGMFGGDCSACHNTSAWRPTAYNGPHNFPMNHHANTCADCHQPNLTTWSCALCHDQAKMDEHHKEVNGYDGNCLKCHPTGRKD